MEISGTNGYYNHHSQPPMMTLSVLVMFEKSVAHLSLLLVKLYSSHRDGRHQDSSLDDVRTTLDLVLVLMMISLFLRWNLIITRETVLVACKIDSLSPFAEHTLMKRMPTSDIWGVRDCRVFGPWKKICT